MYAYRMILDVVAATILFLSMLIAWFRGFIRETLTILGLIGSGIAALFGSPYLVPILLGWFPQKTQDDKEPLLFGIIPYEIIAIALAYVLVFIFVYVILSICAHWLAKAAKEAGLGALDRSLGVLFGLIRAVVLIGFLFIPFNAMLDKDGKEEWFGDSISLPYVDYVARVMRAAIPNPLGSDEDKDGKDGEKEDKKPSGPLGLLQNKALQNLEETRKLLKDIDPKELDDALNNVKKLGEEDGYSDEEREAIKKLFDLQQDPQKEEKSR